MLHNTVWLKLFVPKPTYLPPVSEPTKCGMIPFTEAQENSFRLREFNFGDSNKKPWTGHCWYWYYRSEHSNLARGQLQPSDCFLFARCRCFFFPHPEKWELSLYVARRTVDMTDMLWCSSFIYSYADHTKHTKHTTLHTIFDPSPTQSLPKGRPLNTTTDLLPKKNETKISKKLKVGGSFEPPILKNLLVKLDDFPYFAGHKYSKSLKKKLHHLVSPIFWEIPPPKKVKKNVVESLGPVKTLAHSR